MQNLEIWLQILFYFFLYLWSQNFNKECNLWWIVPEAEFVDSEPIWITDSLFLHIQASHLGLKNSLIEEVEPSPEVAARPKMVAMATKKLRWEF